MLPPGLSALCYVRKGSTVPLSSFCPINKEFFQFLNTGKLNGSSARQARTKGSYLLTRDAVRRPGGTLKTSGGDGGSNCGDGEGVTWAE